jgi:hypothetical protein
MEKLIVKNFCLIKKAEIAQPKYALKTEKVTYMAFTHPVNTMQLLKNKLGFQWCERSTLTIISTRPKPGNKTLNFKQQFAGYGQILKIKNGELIPIP